MQVSYLAEWHVHYLQWGNRWYWASPAWVPSVQVTHPHHPLPLLKFYSPFLSENVRKDFTPFLSDINVRKIAQACCHLHVNKLFIRHYSNYELVGLTSSKQSKSLEQPHVFGQDAIYAPKMETSSRFELSTSQVNKKHLMMRCDDHFMSIAESDLGWFVGMREI